MGESIVIGLTATGKDSFAGRTMRVVALLLLFGLLALSGATPGPAGDADTPSSHGAMAGDNAAFLARNARVSERLFGLPGLTNVGRVANGIFRGAQPKPEGYATLKAMGVRTVVNLRSRHGEREAVEAAGMRSIEIPMNTMKNVDPAAVREALSVMTDPANRPVFVHCQHGKDRTGLVVAVYRMEVDGWSEVEAEMDAFGFHEIWFRIKKFVRQYPVEGKGTRAGNGP